MLSERLPAMRKGFGVLNDNDRSRLMKSLEYRIDVSGIERMTYSPELVAVFTKADFVAFESVQGCGWSFEEREFHPC